MRKLLALVWLLWASIASAQVPAVPAVRHLVGALTFSEDFAATCPVHCDFNALYPRLKTNFYFGNQSDATSRMYAGTRNVMLDPTFYPGSFSPQAPNGNLYIYAWKLPPADAATFGREYGSSVVSTEKSFSQAYGYFEIKAKLPTASGTWPAFWLLPVAKTADNGGRLPEIDVFEHYAGTFTVLSSNGTKNIINRVSQPIFTLHYGKTGAEQATSAWPLLPPAGIDLGQFHTFGFLWTPDTMTAYIDQVQTFTMANPGVVDPHYIVLSMDVADRAGDPALGTYPAAFIVDYVRAWALP